MRRGFATKPLPWLPPLPTRIGLAAYNLFAEFASPLYAAHAYRRAGRKALEHAFTLNAPPRPRILPAVGARRVDWRDALDAAARPQTPRCRRFRNRPHHGEHGHRLGRVCRMEGLGPRVLLRHRPHDGGSAVRRFLAHWRPSGLLLVESELWPNLIVQTRRAGVPIALVNARLSARSLARWMALAPAARDTCSAAARSRSRTRRRWRRAYAMRSALAMRRQRREGRRRPPTWRRRRRRCACATEAISSN